MMAEAKDKRAIEPISRELVEWHLEQLVGDNGRDAMIIVDNDDKQMVFCARCSGDSLAAACLGMAKNLSANLKLTVVNELMIDLIKTNTSLPDGIAEELEGLIRSAFRSHLSVDSEDQSSGDHSSEDHSEDHSDGYAGGRAGA